MCSCVTCTCCYLTLNRMRSYSALQTLIRSRAWKKIFVQNFYTRTQMCVKIAGLQNTTVTLLAQFPKKGMRNLTVSTVCTSNQYSNRQEDTDSEMEDSLVALQEFYNESEMNNGIHVLRDFLYPSSKDPLLSQLNECASVHSVLDIVSKHRAELNSSHVSQAVLILWDIQRMYYKVNISNGLHRPSDEFFVDPRSLLNEYSEKLNGHEHFQLLLNLVESKTTEFSPDAATCTLLYLSRMGLSMKSSVLQNLIRQSEMHLNKMGSLFPMTALSRLSVALYDEQPRLWYLYTLQNAVPLIFRNIYESTNALDLYLLTICLSNIRQFVDNDTLNAYKQKVVEMMQNGIISHESSKLVVKIITFLNLPHWSQQNVNLIRNLMLVMKKNISSLDITDLVLVHKAFQSILEPADLLSEMQDCAKRILCENDNFTCAMYTSSDLVSCISAFSSPKEKQGFEKLAWSQINSPHFAYIMPSLYKVIRHIKTSDIKLCNSYWSKTWEHVSMLPKMLRDYHLHRLCHRYMHFNNNLGGTYRHYEFEKEIIQRLMIELETDISKYIPSKFACIAAFLTAYGSLHKEYRDSTLGIVLEKLTEMLPQLTAEDCMNISRGYQIAIHLISWTHAPVHTLTQLVQINSLLNMCTKRLLKEMDFNIFSTNRLARAYVSRKGTYDSDLFHSLIDRYENFTGHLSSRALKDVCSNLLATSCLIPKTVDSLAEYVIQSNEHLHGNTVERLLHLCYHLGYTPVNSSQFLRIASDIIVRDKSQMSGLALLQSALALCYFHQLPEPLFQFIFSVDFLERLDCEIDSCYSKAIYARRLRDNLMQLNRAVCLDYPEADVPWFHKKYCEEIASLEPAGSSLLHKEVKAELVDILQSKELVKQDVYAPYGFKIDFQIQLNKENIPIPLKKQTDKNVTRIAFLLHKENAFCNNVRGLKGRQKMNRRHLEILGYRVLEINSVLWNSMYMSEPGAKYKYLVENIWPSEAKSNVKNFLN